MAGTAADRLVANLVDYLTDNQGVTYTVKRPDANGERDLPVVVVQWVSMDQSAPGLLGHYTVQGAVSLISVGYDDSDNSDADAIMDDLETLLHDTSAVKTAVNSGDRPAVNIHLNGFFIRGMETETENKSNITSLVFEAFIRACD